MVPLLQFRCHGRYRIREVFRFAKNRKNSLCTRNLVRGNEAVWCAYSSSMGVLHFDQYSGPECWIQDFCSLGGWASQGAQEGTSSNLGKLFHDYQLLRDDRQIEMEVPDVMSWLIDATAKSEESQRRAEEDLLESDSRLIIVAGRYRN